MMVLVSNYHARIVSRSSNEHGTTMRIIPSVIVACLLTVLVWPASALASDSKGKTKETTADGVGRDLLKARGAIVLAIGAFGMTILCARGAFASRKNLDSMDKEIGSKNSVVARVACVIGLCGFTILWIVILIGIIPVLAGTP
jgi:hypothetical protein